MSPKVPRKHQLSSLTGLIILAIGVGCRDSRINLGANPSSTPSPTPTRICPIGQKLANGVCVLDVFLGADAWGWDSSQYSTLYTQGFRQFTDDLTGIRIIGVDLSWSDFELTPPDTSGHFYQFNKLDDLMVKSVSPAGLVVDLSINCRSSWATEKDLGSIGAVSEACCDMSPPKSDSTCLAAYGVSCTQAWEDFVRAVVERYDADGDTGCKPSITPPDCYRPGDGQYPAFVLNYPLIHSIQTGNEPDNPEHFGAAVRDRNNDGSVSSVEVAQWYNEVLTPFYRGAKAARPDTLVLRGRTNPGSFFDDLAGADLATIDSTVRTRWPGYLETVETSIDLSQNSFDGFAINYNDHYTELIGFSNWIRTKMQANGYNKPLFVGDARTSLYPRGNEVTSGLSKILPSVYPVDFITCLNSPLTCIDYNAKNDLLQSDKVNQTIRKIAVALGAGIQNISLQPIAGNQNANLMWVNTGLINTTIAVTDLRAARELVYHAVVQLMAVVSGALPQTETISVGTNVFAYRVTKEGKRYWIVWNEDPKLIDTNTGLVQRNQTATIDLSPHIGSKLIWKKPFAHSFNPDRTPVVPAPTQVDSRSVDINENPIILEE